MKRYLALLIAVIAASVALATEPPHSEKAPRSALVEEEKTRLQENLRIQAVENLAVANAILARAQIRVAKALSERLPAQTPAQVDSTVEAINRDVEIAAAHLTTAYRQFAEIEGLAK
jgi:hypothetical protein